jgi:Holliday junction resolvase-like predicted endonuclease
MSNSKKLKKIARVLVPCNWTNDKKGKFFEKVVGDWLKQKRYEVKERIRFTGMEIDLVADNIDTKQRIFVECKFVQDSLSANVVDSLIGKAVRKQIEAVFLFSTASLGKEAASVGWVELRYTHHFRGFGGCSEALPTLHAKDYEGF